MVNTHIGKIPVSELGTTLIHEHIFNRFPWNKGNASNIFTLQQLEKLESYSVRTVVDLTPYTSLGNYSQILQQTKIRIVCCVGFYLVKYIPRAYQKYTTQELVAHMSNQIEKGRGEARIRPGILKVAGQGLDMTDLEKRLFSAIGILQMKHKLPIATHSPRGAYGHLHMLMEAGADPNHIFISHMDRGLSGSKVTLESRYSEILEILGKGAYVLFTEFGNGRTPNSKNVDMIIEIVSRLRSNGYIRQMLISSDSNWRWRRGEIRLKESRWGGIPRSYDYLFTRILPVLKEIGFTEQDLMTMLISNPQRLFSF